MSGNLDMSDGRDRRVLHGALSKKWPIDAEDLIQYKKALDFALAEAIKSKNVRAINSTMRTIAAITSQMQSDEQFEARYMQAASGHAESVSEIRVVYGDDQEQDGDDSTSTTA